MAVSGKYGTLHVPNVGDDEPVFILRGKDKLAVAAMQMYQALARSHASPVAEGMEDEIQRFEAWDGLKEIPD